MPEINMLGYNIFSGEKEFFANEIHGVVCTLSPHSYIVARKDVLFQKALAASEYILPDGIGIVLAVNLLKRKKIDKIAGFDLHEVIINALNRSKGSCFYLGSTNTTLTKISQRLEKEYADLRFGTLSPPFKDNFDEDDNISMINTINQFNPDVLFVGMTAPKQEKWVYENRHRINARLICSIGAVFDFYSGTVKRPAEFWINAGLEWLPRLLKEPRRLWKRTFISAPVFLWYVFLDKIQKRHVIFNESNIINTALDQQITLGLHTLSVQSLQSSPDQNSES